MSKIDEAIIKLKVAENYTGSISWVKAINFGIEALQQAKKDREDLIHWLKYSMDNSLTPEEYKRVQKLIKQLSE